MNALFDIGTLQRIWHVWQNEGRAGLLKRLRRRYRRISVNTPLRHGSRAISLDRRCELTDVEYADRLEEEIANFKHVRNVHDLPDIFHYWSQKYLLPKFQALNIPGVTELFARYIAEACRSTRDNMCYVASLGTGNCEAEVAMVEQLVANGVTAFQLDCIEVNPHMLARGKELASSKLMLPYMRFVASDVKRWKCDKKYSVIVANQSLHHFQDLEVLFENVRHGIGESGVFVVSDVIGRNGHMRWPEALEVIHKVWKSMPDRYKYNHLLSRYEHMYENWDCSVGGFEGIRAQDILPLLSHSFKFEIFLAYGNIIDIFIDRAFGHNFDMEVAADREFIDRVAQLDEELLAAGTIKPTHLIASMRNSSAMNRQVYRHFTPEFCLRPTN
ncbi:MAG: class I SAM-dependent methyltransferase [Nitrospira sp.]|nr:class I SAM-dependent methyltransferase [Nitrospira sp.]